MSTRLVDLAPDAVEVRDLWVPVRDGVRLHARVWLPAGASASPVPALLEYLPYRLDDWTSVRDSERHPFYAAHGYASVRVDVRGTGSSEGLFTDEYAEAELADGEDLIAWLADQPWCSGRVGVFGISWGGFNALQLAARRPPALHAVVTCCSTDDRYDNDVHYVGGAVLGIDMTAWAGTMLAFGARPPRPEVVGADWVRQWRERLVAQQPLAPVWLSHQQRDAYWRRGSICEDYGAVQAAVLAVGGWADPYRDTVLRLLEHLPGPRKGLLGPWPHQYPDRDTAPGPMIDFLGETLRWWDHWLKDDDTGVRDDPDLRVWVNRGARPATWVAEQPGRWLGVTSYPPGDGAGVVCPLGDTGVRAVVASPWATGQDSGRFFPFGSRTDLPPDQRAEDGRSTCVDLPRDAVPGGFLGRAQARLRLRSTDRRGHVVVRLCEVWPDGASTLLTRGVLNLARRHGMDRADPMPDPTDPSDPDGGWVDVVVPLVAAGHELAEDTRLRVAISDHYWPWVWPHETDGSLEVDLGASELWLPEVPDGAPISFGPPRHARPLAAVSTPAAGPSPGPRVLTHDVERGLTRLVVDPEYGGGRTYPDGLHWTEDATETYEVVEGDPLSPRATSVWEIGIDGEGWGARISTSSAVGCEPGAFVLHNEVKALAHRGDGDWQVVHEAVHRHRVPRSWA